MGRWTVGHVMTTGVVSVPPTSPFRDVADILAEYRIGGVPVVDADGHVLGVVSQADLLHKVEYAGERARGYLFEGTHRRTARAKATATDARSLMTTPAVTTTAEVSIVEAARLMDGMQISRLPVVDADGRLAGIVCRGDLLEVFQRMNVEIREDIREQVLRWVLPPGHQQVRVDVDRGTVTLTGEVESASLAALIGRLTAAVDGVVEVVDRLGHGRNDGQQSDVGPRFELV